VRGGVGAQGAEDATEAEGDEARAPGSPVLIGHAWRG
jgi:hypothetical protein